MNFLFQDTDSYMPLGNKVLFFLDCGHGGIVHGKYTTAPDKMYKHKDFTFYEGVFNRQVGSKVAKLFKENTLNYWFTTISNWDIPLRSRVFYIKRISSLYRDMLPVVLSIHGNAAGVESASGVEAYTTPGITPSDYAYEFYWPYVKKLGLKNRIHKDVFLERDKESKFYILTQHPYPSILFEFGFFTNYEEAKKMTSEEWQDKFAQVILNGSRDLVSYYTEHGTLKK